MYQQLIEPDPNIPCKPGWCLQYVRQAYGLPAVEPSATVGWENAKYKHEDQDFPDAWVPLWFSIDTIPEGHVVLRAPDGRIFSTSTPGNTPYVHPSLEHLIWYYGDRVEPQYRLVLRYLGWSEDISNSRVVELVEDDMQIDKEQAEDIVKAVVDRLWSRMNNQVLIHPVQAESIAARGAVLTLEQLPDVSEDLVQAMRDKVEALDITLNIK